MKLHHKILSSIAVALAMAASSNVLAAEKIIKPAQAIEEALSKAQVALNGIKAGSSAEEISKLIKEVSESTGEIAANYKTEKARDTAIIHLKDLRKKLKEGKTAEAVEEDLKNVMKEISDIKGLI